MCLGVPGKVITVEGLTAIVDFFGVRRAVRLDVVDTPVVPGDYVMNHVGFAIRRIPADEIGVTLDLYQQLLDGARAEDDPDLMLADVRAELRATESKS